MALMRNIVVVPYDSHWSAEFESESRAIRAALNDFSIVIEHIGSTSIPGMPAKSVIDILLIVPELHELDARNEAMIRLGYEPKGELGIAGRRFYSKGGDSSRTHHIHAFEAEHPAIENHRKFRDFLRTHPEQADQYGKLKQRLATEHRNDIESYIAGKSPFIAEILKSAWEAGEGR